MAINEAAYLRVGLGMIPEDTKKEMKEEREDTTKAWRLPPAEERGTAALSEEEAAAIGLSPHLSAERVDPRRGLEEWDWQPDPGSLARNPVFQRFAQVMEQIEQHIEAEADFGHLVDELDQLEGFVDDEDIEFADMQERRFVRQKIGGAKRAAARAGLKWRRQNPAAARKKNRQSKMWHARHKSHDKMISKTARQGYRRSEGSEGYSGRMESISDDPHDREEQRRLAGLTESRSEAFSTTGVLDARRPQNVVVEEAPTEMLASFRHLMGWRG